jgi:transposase InsO family protein
VAGDDGPGVRVAEDLLDRDFEAAAPNRCWVADITYLRSWEGWLAATQELLSPLRGSHPPTTTGSLHQSSTPPKIPGSTETG